MHGMHGFMYFLDNSDWKIIGSWHWGGWSADNWAYTQNRGVPLSPWMGADSWGHQLGAGRGNIGNTSHSHSYGNGWGNGNGVVSGALHGYGGVASVGATSSSKASGGNRKGYSQR